MAPHALIAGRVNCYNMAMVTLGERALVSQGAYLCAGTHAIDDANFQLVAKPITLGANCWIATEAFVGPGVTVGDGAVLSARGVALANLEPWAVYVGNPAQFKRFRKLKGVE
jgi:putative colanic acid biosynthesis acetyltransferase WcaF